MTIHAFQSVYKSLTAFTLVAVITACGGGGSGGSKTPTPDTTPDALTIAAVTNAAVSADVTSAPVTISGINQATSISIVGGTYSIAGASYTDVAGTVTNGQAITVKVKTSDKTNTAVAATLTIGGVNGQFKVTTAPDVTPDAFTFTDAKDVAPKSVNTSTAITVAGVDVAVPISITGGEYSVNDSAFTSTAGTVSNGQTVKVHMTASDKVSTDVTAVLTIGGADKAVSANYKVTTFADTVAPTAQILFPPPVSMTEGNTILVRGSASDDYSTIASVKVNGVEATPKSVGDYSSWQVSVSLTATTDNTVVVTTKDSAGNESTNAAKVMVRQGDHKNAFPDASIAFDTPYSIAIDTLDGRKRLLVADRYSSPKKIVAIDLVTGERSVFLSETGSLALAIEPGTKRLYSIETSSPNNLVYFELDSGVKHVVAPTNPYINNVVDYDASIRYRDIFSLVIDNLESTVKVVGLGNTNGEIISNSISSSTLSVISDGVSGLPNSENILINPATIVLDAQNSRYLVTTGGQDTNTNNHAIYAIDRKTGARSVLSSNLVGSGDNFSSSLPDGINPNLLGGLDIDTDRHQAIASEFMEGRFYTIDLLTGNRKLFSDSTSFNSINSIKYNNAIALDVSKNYLFVSDSYNNGIYAVDLITGQRVIFSKSVSDN